MISATDPAALASATRGMRARIERRGGLTVVGEQDGAALAGGASTSATPTASPSRRSRAAASRPSRARAPLGRRGGRSAPASSCSATPTRRARSAGAAAGRLRRQRLLPRLPQAPPGRRRVPAALREAAALYPGGEELLAAKIVGRWRDGTPLDRLPRRPDPASSPDPARNNAFSYADDPDGLRCPVGAHVRRINPRHSLPFDGKLVNRHRLIRRGIPYGEPLPEGAEDDGQDRGVIFMCLQASIARQFEFVQSQWLNGGNAFRLGEDQDVLVGRAGPDGPRKMTSRATRRSSSARCRASSRSRGGEYFFAPGINGLRHLAENTRTN